MKPIRYALPGETYGRLTVIAEASRQGRRRMVRCRCACGGTKTALVDNLRSGYTRSCGCFQREQLRAALVQHDRSGSPEHIVWWGMIERCENPNSTGFHKYGGRGITLCPRWRASFAAFLHDMGPRPSPSHTIDRINNDRGYSAKNCRWATAIEQANNRRTSHFVKRNGQRKTIAQWAREMGVPYGTMRRHLRQNSWPDSGKGGAA